MPLTRRTTKDPPDLLVGVVAAQLAATTPIEQDFARLYKEVHPQAVSMARRLVPREVALDVVNDVALELYRHWNKLPLDAKRGSYFLRRVFWRVRDQLKRDARLVSLPDERDTGADSGDEYRYPAVVPTALRVSEPSSEPDAVEVVQNIIYRMPPQRRRAFVLSRDGFTHDEIAEVMQISRASVNTHMTLANRQLKDGAIRAGLRAAPPGYKLLPSAGAPVRRKEPDNG